MSARLRPAGPIGWMARHAVAPNLLMALMILGGLLMSSRVTQEVFPPFELDQVTVQVALPGATPGEVEQSVVLPVEEALEEVEGIDRLAAEAQEGLGIVRAELERGTDRRIVYDEIRQAVARITTLPEDAEAPVVRLVGGEWQVMEIQLHGAVAPYDMRMAAERFRERLLLDPGIGRVRLDGVRDLEIHVEIPQGALRAHGLTLDEVARVIRLAALDRAGGTLETRGGDLLLRLADRRVTLDGFAAIPLIADPRGTLVRLGDVAELSRGFAEGDRETTFEGEPTIQVNVFRTGEETPISVAKAVRAALPEALAPLPEAIDATITEDMSAIYADRMTLLLKNGFIGLVLVLVLLSLFLEYRLAFWVAVGIPTAFLGTFLFLPLADASINMVTMFAFILALGLVVDDAIVAGENIYAYRERGVGRLEAAIQGARDIAVPLSFSILTNIVAFLPLAMIPGAMGNFFAWIPLVVGAAFLLSWVEALFVLPAHLAAVRERGARPPNRLERVQARVAAALAWFVARAYAPVLSAALAWRYLTVAAMIGLLAVVLAVPMSGRMGFSLFPPVPNDAATVSVSLPVGAPAEAARDVRARIVEAARQTVAEHGGARLSRGIYASVTDTEVSVRVYLTPPDVRPLPTAEFARLWRERVGQIPEATSSRYVSSFAGPGGQTSIEVRLSHASPERLATAARRLADALARFESVRDPDDGFTPGKVELAFSLTEAGRVLGLTSEEIGRQVRAAFQGVEALTQQEGRNEVTVRVRLPEGERRSEGDVETLLIRTPDGGEVPLYQIAEVERSRAEAGIERVGGRRTVTVTANVVPDSASPAVVSALRTEILPGLQRDIPGLAWAFGGRQEFTRQTTDNFVQVSIPLALGLMYALLAVPFRSYVQPLIVMAAIPFGAVGAVLGHMLMGMSLSMISVFGMIALSGVVINAAIVMIDLANRERAAGATAAEAVRRAGLRRFRPILLTTLTTFGGLAPMIFETSAQAKFLIPMAVSLGYGILFATVIVLLLIPALYLVLEDLRAFAGARAGGEEPPPRPLDPLPGEPIVDMSKPP